MSPIFFRTFFMPPVRHFIFAGLVLYIGTFSLRGRAAEVGAAGAATSNKASPELTVSLKSLFDHKRHLAPFKDGSIGCTDCHTFSIKSPSFDPLAPNVAKGFLVPSRKVCHECHIGRVSLPRPNQCTLCHKEPAQLKPSDHALSWRSRHGRFAQQDPDSCTKCHSDNQNSCGNCHTQKNTLKPFVHRPNFRVMHSLEARANPSSCIACHSTTSTCVACHKGIP